MRSGHWRAIFLPIVALAASYPQTSRSAELPKTLQGGPDCPSASGCTVANSSNNDTPQGVVVPSPAAEQPIESPDPSQEQYRPRRGAPLQPIPNADLPSATPIEGQKDLIDVVRPDAQRAN